MCGDKDRRVYCMCCTASEGTGIAIAGVISCIAIL